jgi:hypothetical protein
VRKLVLAAAVAALSCAIGCKHPAAARLEGRWRGARAEGVPPAAQDAANAFAAQTEIVAKGNLIAVSTPPSKGSQASPYVVIDENKTTVVLHTDRDGPTSRETFAFSEDGKTMTWRLGEGRAIVFEKAKD